MLTVTYSIGEVSIKPEEREAYMEKADEITREVDKNILNKILKIN